MRGRAATARQRLTVLRLVHRGCRDLRLLGIQVELSPRTIRDVLYDAAAELYERRLSDAAAERLDNLTDPQ